MDPTRGWSVAAQAAQAHLPFKELHDSNVIESLGSGQLAFDAARITTESAQASAARKSRRRRKRFALPLLVAHPAGISIEVLACPDSGSDENIVSLELVNSLGLKIVQANDEPRQFSVANGKIVRSVGQVSTRCGFATGTPSAADLECTLHVFHTLAVPLIMGIEFLQQTETFSKYTDRLVEQLVPAMQTLRVNSVGRPKRSLICRLDTYVGCATVDTGSDLDLVSSVFAKSRAFKIDPASEQVEFADCSVGHTTGVVNSSFVVGNVNSLGFHPRGKAIDLDLFVLDNLNADILVGQDTIETLDIFNLHDESLIPSIVRLGESEVNIIRHIGRLEQGVTKLWKKFKRGFSTNPSDSVTGVVAQVDLDQQENARRERERARIRKLSGSTKERAQEYENATILTYERERRNQLSPPIYQEGALPPLQMAVEDHRDLPQSSFPLSPPIPISLQNSRHYFLSPPVSPPSSPSAYLYGNEASGTIPSIPSSPTSITDRASIDDITSPRIGAYTCTFSGCTAPAFQTQYLLDSHANVHSQARPHYCPVTGCPRSEGGKGFKRKNELIRHRLIVHEAHGHVCPFRHRRMVKYARRHELDE
ncbi:hypothetical protein AK830_g1642 [Neonectria ditissima]|uniref:C2H2-type domain-containing protein n=1 Tax=Neonectria ditissima TaxID=78410 RepID=A0A0P7BI32_9HYPO|nr:hypothetical protein AK830_g1642 [Neonectria ditissima]